MVVVLSARQLTSNNVILKRDQGRPCLVKKLDTVAKVWFTCVNWPTCEGEGGEGEEFRG